MPGSPRRRSASGCGSSPGTSRARSGTWSTPCSTCPRRPQDGAEGCLSIPGLSIDCRRALSVVAQGFDMYGEPVTDRGQRAAGAGDPARDRPPRRRAVPRPARPGEPQAGDEGDPRVRVVRPGRRPDDQGLAAPDRRARSVRRLMRVVFAGTPEVALPALDAVAGLRATSWSGWSPARTRRPGAAAGWRRRRSRERGRGARRPGAASPSTRATRTSRTRCARSRPDCLPGRRLRRAAAAVGARHPAARLGQPALLAAPRVAGRGTGAARDLGRRRRHRRDHVPDRQGARRRPDVRA